MGICEPSNGLKGTGVLYACILLTSFGEKKAQEGF